MVGGRGGGIWRGMGLIGPPPFPGGDQPAPASLESGPSAPGAQKAEEEGSEAAPGWGSGWGGGGGFPSASSWVEGRRVWGQ